MNLLKERIRSKTNLDVGRLSADEPVSPREEKGKMRSPRSSVPNSREASPRVKDGDKSPHGHRRDSDPKDRVRDAKGATVVVSVTEAGEELISLGKSPPTPLPSARRPSKREMLEKLQGRPLLVAKAELPLQLFCWGEGLGSLPTLLQPKGVRNALQISCGPMHSAVLMDNGQIYVWGKNASGQLGTGNTESLDFPTAVPFFSDKDVRAIACGGAQTLALTSANELYQFGYDGFQSNRAPVLVEPIYTMPLRRVAVVAAGPTHSALLTDAGELYTWGQGGKGQLGYDSDKRERPSFVDRFLNKPLRSVSCGMSHTCVISAKNRLWVFGEFMSGTEIRKPHKIVSMVQSEGSKLLRHDSHSKGVAGAFKRKDTQRNVKVTLVTCGLHFTLFISEEGDVWGFGENRHGELGQGNLEPSEQPKRIEALKDPVQAIGCGQTHILAITTTGELWGWGGAANNVLGAQESEDDVTTPRRLRNLRGKIPRLVTGTSTTSLAIMHQGLFGAPFTDLIVNGEIPHRLSSIFSYLELEDHIGHNNIIAAQGFSVEKKKLMLLLDQAAELNLGEYSLNTVASVLQSFFRDSPDCLLSFRHFNTFVKGVDEPTELQRIDAFRSAVLQLPRENVTLLSRLLTFFNKALSKSSTLSPASIAAVYGPLILREPVLPGTEAGLAIPAQVVKAVTFLIEINTVALQQDPAEVVNILLRNACAEQRPRREIWSDWVMHLERHVRLHSPTGSQLFADVLLRSNAPRYLLESIMDRCFPAENEDLKLFTQLVEAMFHIEFDKEQFMGALRQLSLASLNMQQRETIIGLFLSFKRSSAGQLEDVSQEMSRIIARKEQDEQLEESLRDSHRLIVTLTTFREILKKEHIARLSVIHANAPRIQSLVDDAARQLLNLKTELQDQESKLAKIVTRELLQFNDINEKSEELAIREKQLVARKAALEAELLRVNEELNTVRAELKSCATQRNAAFKEKEEEEAKEKVARTKEQMQAQKVFTEALSSCHAYNAKLTSAFQHEEKALQRRLDESTTQCMQALMLHLGLIEQVFQNMMDKLRRANAMLGENTQQPRYIVREYNKEKHLFDHFSSSYEDFKAGTIPLLESLEKERPERSTEISEKISELDRFRERIARSFSEMS